MGLVLGLLAAWLVNYLADILPAQRKLGKPACPSCGTEYRLAGYFSLAACTHCKAPRSWRTYIVLAAGLVLGAVVFLFPPAFGPWIALLLLTYFGVVTVIDVEHRIIMHVTSLAGVLIGLPVGIFLHEPVLTLLGGLVGGGIMLVFYLAGVAFARYRARKLGHDDGEEALGFGDVTIATVLGLMVGWPNIVLALFIGVILGGLFSLLMIIVLLLLKRYQAMTVFTAYGPFLILGACGMLFFAPQVINFLFR